MVLNQEKVRTPKPPGRPPVIIKTPVNKGLVALVILLLVLLALETAIIVAQSQANRKIEAQSEQALSRFLRTGHGQASSGVGSRILMKNVRFCWSKQVCINTDRLTAKALPLNGRSAVNFDDLKSFIVDVDNATVLISPKTLQGMFNESVFNYPGSNLRDLTVGIERLGGKNHVKLNGSLKYLFLWIPFEMDTNLLVDHKTNTLVIAVNTLHVFGIIPATWLIQFNPFNLEKLLTLPPNKYLTVHKNLMMVKPFGLFPPPRINGTMSGIAVEPNLISLSFKGVEGTLQPMPDPTAKNLIYLQGGTSQFGRLEMVDTQIQVIDKNPATPFQFSLLNYSQYLPGSGVKLEPNGAVKVMMADHTNLSASPIGSVNRGRNQNVKTEPLTGKPKPENFIERSWRKIQHVLGL